MLKRLLLLTLLFVVALEGMGQSVTIDKIKYEAISSTEAVLVDGYKAEGDIIIPEYVTIKGNQYRVVRIGNYAFKNHKDDPVYGSDDCCVKSIKIPNSVTYIGDHAFENCTSLVCVTIPDGVTYIRKETFANCISLANITFPNSVTCIGEKAFVDCDSLTTVIIPNNVTKIGRCAFQDCDSLRTITIPNSITEVGVDVLDGCANLQIVMVPDSKPNIDGRGKKNFFGKFLSNLEILINNSRKFPTWVIDDIESNPKSYDRNWQNWAVTKKLMQQELADYTYDGDIPITRNGNNLEYVVLGGEESSESLKEEAHIVNSQQEIDVSQNDNTIEDENEDKNKFGDVDVDIPYNEQTSSNTFAVIIGNENYSQVAKVPYALNDAKTFATCCQKTLGLPQKNIRTYMDATFGIMLSAIENIQGIAKAYKGNINVIFYYAGHGLPNEESKDAFLLPVDASGRNTLACYATNKLYEELAGLGAKSVTVFMDACFSGAQRGEGMLASARGVAIKPRDVEPKGNMVVFSAASADETAYPYTEKGHGLFTYFLLKKLQESKGNATLGELGSYIREKVSQESIVTNGKSQTPTIVSSAALGDGWKNMRLK